MSSLDELTARFPSSEPVSTRTIQHAWGLAAYPKMLVVLDDDPTGTQAVADIPVLTRWAAEDFEWAFQRGAKAVYVMTNSRSLDPEDAEAVNIEVVSNALGVASRLGLDLTFVSRSDSTLRGHFPLEPDTILKQLRARSVTTDAVIVVPAFPEAGRVTVDSVHYARIDANYLPVAQTEFARDATFGYRSSRLDEWVVEKSERRMPVERVHRITLDLIRADHAELVAALNHLRSHQVVVCDAVDEYDLRRLALACLSAENLGRHFVYRCGPSFVRALIGQDDVESLDHLIQSDEWASLWAQRPAGNTNGLVVVGSHVSTTTKQVDYLRANAEVNLIEVDVETLLGGGAQAEIDRAIDQVSQSLGKGLTLLQTSRTLVKTDDRRESLEISRRVSQALVQIVAEATRITPPAFVVAKGGITSSDIASKGLSIEKAIAIGPVLSPGLLSLWISFSKPHDGLAFVVFPGNVGGKAALHDAISVVSTAMKEPEGYEATRRHPNALTDSRE